MKNLTRREFLKAAGSAAVLLPVLQHDPGFAADNSSVKRPNVLFFFPDQHRFDWIGTNSKIPVKTPNLDRLASRGVNFKHVFTPSPLCAPARACLAAGREYDRCGVPSNGSNYPLDQTTFYTLLRESGYHVMGCGKFDLHKATLDWGVDGKRLLKEWGFSDGIDNAGKNDAIRSGAKEPKDPYMAYLKSKGLLETHVEDFRQRSKTGKSAVFPTPLPEEAYCDNWVANNGLELIRNAPAGKPWFLQVNFVGPHSPWDITKEMEALYRGVDFPQPNGSSGLQPETHVAIRRNYSAMVSNIDRWLGVYIDELKKRGELENTLIVYSSDHGEMLGDHGLWGKSVPYQPSVGVPLIIAGPGVRRNVVSNALVSMMDLAATFLAYANIPIPKDMDSLSLKPLLEGSKDKHRECIVSGLRNWRTIYDGRYKLIQGFGGKNVSQDVPPLLFDLHSDPLENNNVAESSKDETARLLRLLKDSR